MVATVWNPEVREGDKVIGVLSNGSYFCHNVTTGQHKYIVNAALDYDREIEVVLRSTARKYIFYSINMGFVSGNGKLEEIDEPLGLSKIYTIGN
jgi:hypothetical protein